MSKKGPVRGTFIKDGSYYLVRAEGKKRIWIRICRVSEGIPAFLLALSKELGRTALAKDAMPQVVAAWQQQVMATHSEKTQVDERRRADVIAKSFTNFLASEVTPPDVDAFLEDFSDTPRTRDLYRAQLFSIFKLAERKGWRAAGTNPVASIPTAGYRPRDRFITDEEMERIKKAAMVGDDGKLTRSGPMLVALIDMAVLTGQRIGDLLDLRWEFDASEPDASHVHEEGIWFRPQKVRGKTGARVLVEWTPALRDVIRRLKEMKLQRPGATQWVFIQKHGQRYTYSGAQTAWKRALRRAEVADVHFHDWRAKAITEKEESADMKEARLLAGHATESQTAAYLRGKTTRRTKATR